MYSWALSGVIERPIKITEEKLIGKPILAQKVPDSFPLEYLALQKHRSSIFLNNLTIIPFGECWTLNRFFRDGVVVRYENEDIAFSVNDVTYVKPEFQNRGIGAEMLCEKYLYYEVLQERAAMEVLPSKAYTENGLKVIKRTYRLLLERGAIYG